MNHMRASLLLFVVLSAAAPAVDSYGCGDPHFEMWSGETFDFRGECDLLLLKLPSFAQGLGLDIHIRTTIRYDYSFIESAAIRIGGGDNAENILEVSAYGEYFLNGVESAVLPAHLGPHLVTYDKVDDNTHHYTIHVGERQTILLKSFKDFVSVKFENAAIDEDFRDSKGLLGHYVSGKLLGRDGETEFDLHSSINDFGQEWQVLPDEPQLFQTSRLPQLPANHCILPRWTTSEARRRLGEPKISREEAEKACAHASADFKKACIYDVMATGDIEMAQAGF